MKSLLVSFLFIAIIQTSIAPPPRRPEKEEEKHEDPEEEGYGLEYDRYLKEVVQVLESDPEFRRKLEAAEETDIRNGKIAHELEFVNHQVRSKLDEIKRAELERLRLLAQKEYELTNEIDTAHMKISPEHLHHENQHTFEIEDLKKLIAKVTKDLNEADKKRKEEFKEYEMQKEFENQEKLKHLEGAEKEAFEKQLKDNETKHKQHEPLHHPGSKQQLEEVWEKQDHMDSQDFDPKVFFQLHDIDGNGFWDQNEVKALFIKELDKMYEEGAPEDDMKERAEELERMREHVFNEADKNHDQLISFQEFMDQTKQPDFNQDPGWEGLDQQKPVYTHEDYVEFERRRQEEIQRMIQQGLIPPQPVYHPDPYQQHHPGVQQHFPQGNYHQQPYAQGMGHPGQPIHPGQAAHPSQGVHPDQQHYQQMQGHPAQAAHPDQQHYQQMQGHPPQPVHPNQQYYQNAQGHPPQADPKHNQPHQGHPAQAVQPNQQHYPQGQGHPVQPDPQYQPGQPIQQQPLQYQQHPPGQVNQQQPLQYQQHPPGQVNQQQQQPLNQPPQQLHDNNDHGAAAAAQHLPVSNQIPSDSKNNVGQGHPNGINSESKH